jgi:hypothetical protein
MAQTAIAVIQTPWDCRWTRIAWKRTTACVDEPPDCYAWLCIREPGAPRRVDERDCEDCPYWEMEDPERNW